MSIFFCSSGFSTCTGVECISTCALVQPQTHTRGCRCTLDGDQQPHTNINSCGSALMFSIRFHCVSLETQIVYFFHFAIAHLHLLPSLILFIMSYRHSWSKRTNHSATANGVPALATRHFIVLLIWCKQMRTNPIHRSMIDGIREKIVIAYKSKKNSHRQLACNSNHLDPLYSFDNFAIWFSAQFIAVIDPVQPENVPAINQNWQQLWTD